MKLTDSEIRVIVFIVLALVTGAVVKECRAKSRLLPLAPSVGAQGSSLPARSNAK